jgi:hypothetical protein
MLKDFKNKRYWILLPIFLIIGMILIIYLPHNFKPLAILTGILGYILSLELLR